MLVRVFSGLLALVFLVFGGLKLLDMHAFVGNVENFRIPPWTDAPWSIAIAYVLVPLELFVGLALLLGFWVRGAALLSLLMILSFMVGIGSVWARGLNIECGCAGGELSLGGYPVHMTILAIMLAVNVYVILDLAFPNNQENEQSS